MEFHLKVPPERAVLLLNERIDAIGTIRQNRYGFEYYDVVRWMSETYAAIDAIYAPDDIRPEEIRSIGLLNCSCNDQVKALMLVELFASRLQDYVSEIRDPVERPEQ